MGWGGAVQVLHMGWQFLFYVRYPKMSLMYYMPSSLDENSDAIWSHNNAIFVPYHKLISIKGKMYIYIYRKIYTCISVISDSVLI